jgi:glycosyltransferase involved in cell wall biosynthesis
MFGSPCCLVVIIPAFQARFLATTLESLANQTDQRFHVFVGDDASPDDLATMVERYQNRLSISYHRFPNNLGGHSLVQHWARCIAHTNEPWIWLFSDDDVMESDCVAAFYRCLSQLNEEVDVLRYDTMFINAADDIFQINPPHPEHESWKTFAYHLLRGMRISTVQELIFSRSAFERIGGFVEFPLAWGSDHATLMALAGKRGVFRISGPKVRFRWSGMNISSVKDRNMDALKLRASMEYVRWLLRAIAETPDTEFPLGDADLQAVAFEWFKDHLAALHTPLFPRQCREIVRFVNSTWGEPRHRSWARLVKLNLALVPHALRQRTAK